MDNFINILLNISVWGVAKIIVIIALLIYLIFAFVMIKQVSLMTRVVSAEWDFTIRVVTWVHFFFALFIMILSIVIL